VRVSLKLVTKERLNPVNTVPDLMFRDPGRLEILGETGNILLAPGSEDQFLDTVDEVGSYVPMQRTVSCGRVCLDELGLRRWAISYSEIE
jgi:hypothetical protein